MFTAAHCSPGAGYAVKGPNGTVIGYWTSAPAYHDLTYIDLITGNWPSTKNIVYSNNGSGGFTITGQPSIDCVGTIDHISYAVYEAFQTSATSTYGTNNGVLTRLFDPAPNCTALTTIDSHYPSGWKDSGAPILLYGHTNTVYGIASARDGSNHLIVTPLVLGMADLNNYWHNYNGTGARLCVTASC